MKNKHFKTIQEVVAAQLCMGCGACIYACSTGAIKLLDIPTEGLRAKVDSSLCRNCSRCVEICPGIEISHQPFNGRTIPALRQAWGPVLEVWEGWATDPESRFKGSSGGVVTALALFCLEQEQLAGALHIAADPDIPWRNTAVFSRDKESLLACTGSRYSPAAPCEKLDWIEQAEANCVLIGKPCDVVALRKVQANNPALDKKVGLAISIFCAGTPTHKGTQALLEALKVKPQEVEEIRYRGCGWPGVTSVKIKGNSEKPRMMSYEKAWGDILSCYDQFRCRLCPDSTGEFADISCGDPWYRTTGPCELGRSLVLVRTARGKKILGKAIQADYIEAEQIAPEALPLSQKALLNKRRNLCGRLIAMQMMRVAGPEFKGFSLFVNWLHLSAFDKTRSVLGTLRRIHLRGVNRKPRHMLNQCVIEDD